MTRMQLIIVTGLFTLLLATPLMAQPQTSERGDAVRIQQGVQFEPARLQDRPARGLHMDRVRDRYGEPRRLRPAVGEPPITRWYYDDFVVVFEHQWVIRAVRIDQPPVQRN